MTTVLSATFAAAVLLLAGPATAQVSQADPQAIARSLADQGYADVRVIEEDGELAVSGTRAGATRIFTYDRDSGRLVPSEDDEPGARDDEGTAGGGEGRGGPGAGDDGEGGRDGDGGAAGDDDGGEDGGDDDGGGEGAED